VAVAGLSERAPGVVIDGTGASASWPGERWFGAGGAGGATTVAAHWVGGGGGLGL